MKRLTALILCLILILTGCANNEDVSGTIPPVVPEGIPLSSTAPTVDPSMTALAAVSVPASTEVFCLEDGTEIYSYTCQHMNLIFPDASVADKVTLEFLNRVDATSAESESFLLAAQTDYAVSEQWIPYFYRVLYSPTRIDHGVLSLFGIQNSYSGGMHGSLSCVSASYDMTTGDVLTLGSIMHANADKEDFIQLVLAQLEPMKETYYLYDDYEDAVRARLGGDENLYEDFYFTQTGLCFFFSPYEIAPYASGVITVELPYASLPGLIYDGYFPAERQVVDGTMKTGSFMDTDMTQFNNMAEVILADGNDMYVVYPEGPVEDVRIQIASDGMTMPEYTVFAALELTNMDAVVLNIPQNLMEDVTITYRSDGGIHTIPMK